MIGELLKKNNKAFSWGLLGNHQYFCKKAMMISAMEDAKARKEHHHKTIHFNKRMKRADTSHDPLVTNEPIKKAKLSDPDLENQSILNSKSIEVTRLGPSASLPDHQNLMTTLRESWEVDSGFCSEASPPASGRSSPWFSTCPTSVVAMDCEMVGTGPGARCSEVARCSILDYHGNVLYDKYIRPCQPVTDFRTRWSGIQRHHLHDATPFIQAREEILRILEGKVVVGHSIYNDFEVLDIIHPGHMVRDTCTTRLLSRLAGFPCGRCPSLKILSCKLLNRKIQAGRRGHSSVEDALASLDLYKLVEGEWEQEIQRKLTDNNAPSEPSYASSNHYMQDEYWPCEVTGDRQ
ncbi:apoptosis-enhancing nuclease isoform 1-T3 [Menidia menidia]|uniref:(Atlantic silverside) hypothetical protein n=1 Tax=Menidia menidia TaxID=238744 RepID=A0A8S4B9R8_9TELE|nr:unnamed protein product [Menidia menidia]